MSQIVFQFVKEQTTHYNDNYNNSAKYVFRKSIFKSLTIALIIKGYSFFAEDILKAILCLEFVGFIVSLFNSLLFSLSLSLICRKINRSPHD